MPAIHPKPTALLLIDVINDFDFKTRNRLLRYARPAAARIAALKTRLRNAGSPAIYVNDNFGRWQSDFRTQVESCCDPSSPGHDIASLLRPAADDYFVLKPKHSGFYSTSLEILLKDLGIRTLVITGFAGDICVLYTANDAYMRDYDLIVPSDCVASETLAGNRAALHHMKTRLKARVVSSRALRA